MFFFSLRLQSAMNLSTSAILGLLVMVAAAGLVNAEGKFFCSKDRPEAFCITPHQKGNGEEYDSAYGPWLHRLDINYPFLATDQSSKFQLIHSSSSNQQ
ncbi:hypothetical protein PGTUg99_004431 [Puccinia graminis f. sp. tritici]|uniref:Uncharacterized protein n=1 Tax=Puccinia graminis f. sp. tritici TaxID=56615 RepID=A0A5B0LHP0_PUCGR|nr:hypothetical protein PGTUg99_004431 [Puccinia graminis f. sp. tritici]